MPPLALCSRLQCDFVLPLHDRERGESTPTPRSCPVCDAEVLSLCADCGFPILGSVAERQIECPVCHADLKRTFADKAGERKRFIH
jgi:hypothetical protein